MKSRKLWITVLALALIWWGFLLCAFVPGARPMFAEFCMGVVGAGGSFLGANVLAKKRRRVSPSVPR